MKKLKIFALLVVVLFIFTVSFVSTTIAKYVKEDTGAMFNLSVRADGNIDLSLTEGDNTTDLWENAEHNLAIIPGVTIPFNPYVRVGSGSEPAYLFIEVTKEGSGAYSFDELIELGIDTGWQKLDGVANVYYTEIEKSANPQYFPIVSGDAVTFSEYITEEDLGSFRINGWPKITITAYAVQKTNLDKGDPAIDGAKSETPAAAWEYLKV